VGSLLDANALHPGRSAWHQLLWIAQSNGIGQRRVSEVMALTGLEDVARRRVKGFSLGMKQRLGIAAALLGDPPTLVFDEPANGLDPEGILWIRELFKKLANEGRTVFVSSHLMSEMALSADHLVIIGRGKVLADAPTEQFVEGNAHSDVLVRSPQANELATKLKAVGAVVVDESSDAIAVTGLEAATIADLAAGLGIAVHELSPRHASLERAYLDITRDSIEFKAGETAQKGSADQ
jgi:ABC-2 type transport system ATP-binding protein